MIKKDNSQEMQLFLAAEIRLDDRPDITNDNILEFPKTEQQELGQALSHYANMISVSEVCRVDISSPTPSRGLIPETNEEKSFLENSGGLQEKIIACIQFAGGHIEAIGKDQLLDRKESVSFLATANGLNDNVAKLHEYVRLFERAFAASSSKLATLLFKFLSQNSLFDYTKEELKTWMVEKRHGATHADRRKTFVFSTDLINDIERIRQAAYDVLFNKVEWNSRSTTRREILKLHMMVSKRGMTIIKAAQKDHISLEDERFIKVDLGDIDFYGNPPKLPQNWWTKQSSPTITSEKFEFRVI